MGKRRHLPGWLYEALPYIYTSAGLVVMVGLKGGAAKLSGLLLVSAGFVVWQLRRIHRKSRRYEAAAHAESLDLFGENSDNNSNLMRIVWRPAFEIGHELLDRQHRRLFSLGNQLINGLMNRQSKGDIELLLSELVDDIAEHFTSEEDIMASLDHPLSEEHKAIHNSLLTQIRELHRRFHHDTLPTSDLVGFIAYSVIAEHVMKDDRKLSLLGDAPAAA